MKKEKLQKRKVTLKNTWPLHLMLFPGILILFVYTVLPFAGNIMAFQDFQPILGFFKSKWVGLDNFIYMFQLPDTFQIFRNTLIIAVGKIVLNLVMSIIFAILLYEAAGKRFKKSVQTICFLPHFLSWIIVTGIVQDVLSMEHGIINQVLQALHIVDAPINWFAQPKYFWWIVGFSNVWKETGWNAIIYLASITSINPDLYEAASIDGAGRFRKMWNITLPSLKPTIFILLLINVGNVLNAGFEVQYLLGNGVVQSVSQTIDIYVLKYGISQGDYALGTAAGIFKSVVSIILILLANSAAKAAGEERLF